MHEVANGGAGMSMSERRARNHEEAVRFFEEHGTSFRARWEYVKQEMINPTAHLLNIFFWIPVCVLLIAAIAVKVIGWLGGALSWVFFG